MMHFVVDAQILTDRRTDTAC